MPRGAGLVREVEGDDLVPGGAEGGVGGGGHVLVDEADHGVEVGEEVAFSGRGVEGNPSGPSGMSVVGPAGVVPGGFEEAEGMGFVEDFAVGEGVIVVEPRAADGIEAVVEAVVEGFPRGFLGFAIFWSEVVAPIAEDKILGEGGEDGDGVVVAVVDVAVEGGVFARNEHIVPDHGTNAALLEEVAEEEEVVEEEVVEGLAAAGEAGLRVVGFVAPEMKVGRILEQVEEIVDEIGEEGAGGGVAEAPNPAIGLEERGKLGVTIEKDVLAGGDAGGGGVPEDVELRDEGEAEVAGELDEATDVVGRCGSFGEAELGVGGEAERAPELKNNGVVFEGGGEADLSLNLKEGRFAVGEEANVKTSEGEVWRIGDFEARDDPRAGELLDAAFGLCKLAEGLQGVANALAGGGSDVERILADREGVGFGAGGKGSGGGVEGCEGRRDAPKLLGIVGDDAGGVGLRARKKNAGLIAQGEDFLGGDAEGMNGRNEATGERGLFEGEVHEM